MAAKKKVRRRAGRPVAATPTLPGEVVGEINGFPIRRLSVEALEAASYNPRKITPEALNGLKTSVTEFGLPQAIVWNRRTRRVVGGHQRLKTLPPGSLTDVVEVDLDEDKEKALNLALNSGHIAGNWTSALGQILDDLKVSVPDLAAGLRFDELSIDVPVDLGADFKRPEFDDILEGGEFKRSQVVKDGNWFYVEFYEQDERFARLVKLLGDGLLSPHEIDKDFFERLIVRALGEPDAAKPRKKARKTSGV